jgi:hypothetical protein
LWFLNGVGRASLRCRVDDPPDQTPCAVALPATAAAGVHTGGKE